MDQEQISEDTEIFSLLTNLVSSLNVDENINDDIEELRKLEKKCSDLMVEVKDDPQLTEIHTAFSVAPLFLSLLTCKDKVEERSNDD